MDSLKLARFSSIFVPWVLRPHPPPPPIPFITLHYSGIVVSVDMCLSGVRTHHVRIQGMNLPA